MAYEIPHRSKFLTFSYWRIPGFINYMPVLIGGVFIKLPFELTKEN